MLIVGAGIVGLALAAAALRRGLSVTVVERDARAVGASVRNFGHCCTTAQSGELLELALLARERWLEYGRAAGIMTLQSGALAVARSRTELEVLEQLSASREVGQVVPLSSAEVRETFGDRSDVRIIGGARLRDDLRVDPREAVGGLAAWLAGRGVRFLWQTSYQGGEDGVARTSRGRIRSARTLVSVGHELDYLFPALAAEHEVQRCGLQMARIAVPEGTVIRPAVLTGTSMLRYPAFAETPAAARLAREIGERSPELIAIGANVMFTQRPDGTLIVGDSHFYADTMHPFQDEATSERLLSEIVALLGLRRLRVVERWQGVYASSPRQPFLVAEAAPGVTAVSVTSGVGMTISLGLAERVLDGLG
nr:TIGR03364 family FAD-dependent oxidoreductase [Galbitalea soli]